MVKFDYKRQIEEIVNYIKSGETLDYKVGIEFEHFIIDKDSLKTVSYYGEKGVEETLGDLVNKGWTPEGEGQYVLGLKKGKKTISLEPGSQLEISVEMQTCIEILEKEYLDFLKDLIPILESKNQKLIALGYHPVSKIDEIRILPKERYDHMYTYFKSRGSHAHNMMKGTASVQVTIDYKDHKDYERKFRIANALSPIFYAMFENAYFFEGEETQIHNIRSFIWENCDKDRSGIVQGALDNEDFSYEKYAEYILNRPPIFEIKDGKIIASGNKKTKDLFNPEDYKIEELDHLLTMFFPDVRTKRYIEIRMFDAVPYPLNFSIVALIKGLFYDENNLDILYDYSRKISMEDIEEVRKEMKAFGLGAKLKDKFLLEIARDLSKLAKEGLDEKEKDYLLPLDAMLEDGLNPYLITGQNEGEDRKEAISWSILNNVLEDYNGDK